MILPDPAKLQSLFAPAQDFNILHRRTLNEFKLTMREGQKELRMRQDLKMRRNMETDKNVAKYHFQKLFKTKNQKSQKSSSPESPPTLKYMESMTK